MLDQLRIGNKYSYDDFSASVKERKKISPRKKSIKGTVPFSNITYDFSDINGEVYWEESEWHYVFEITASSAERLEEKKIAFKSWIMNAIKEKIYDPYIKGYHIVGTFSDIDEDDSEFEKSTITVKFTAYPYMISDNARVHTFALEAGAEKTVVIKNNSSHKISPTIITESATIIRMDGASYSVTAGEITDNAFKLAVGSNVLKITANEAGNIVFRFHEEVF